jgi:hypothetical protein
VFAGGAEPGHHQQRTDFPALVTAKVPPATRSADPADCHVLFKHAVKATAHAFERGHRDRMGSTFDADRRLRAPLRIGMTATRHVWKDLA